MIVAVSSHNAGIRWEVGLSGKETSPKIEDGPEGRPRRFLNHPIWDRWSGFVIVFGVILTFYVGAKWLTGAPLTNIVAEALFFVLLITVGILKVAYPGFGRIVERGLSYYLHATFLLLAALGPFSIFFAVLRWGTDQLSNSGQVVVFGIAAALWASLAAAVAHPWVRDRFFDALTPLGWAAPTLVFANFILISVILFGFAGRLALCESDTACVLVEGAEPADIPLDTYLNVFIWEVLDAIPFLDVANDVPRFDPLAGATPHPALGWLVVAFKFAVIVPGFGAFAAYRGRKASPEPASPDYRW